MQRRTFLGLLAGGTIMSGLGLNKLFEKKDNGIKMPSLFIGHGSPMNAIETNQFTQTLNKLGKSLPRPEAILCISAHWMTAGTWVTEMQNPPTIHDFYGFPQALFDVQYPAPGGPEIAREVVAAAPLHHIKTDSHEWGLDHGTWSVLRHMYPEADVPVLQLSLNMNEGPEYHFQLAKEIAKLRSKGVMIIGSGNIVHNLRRLDWSKNARAYDWAIEFDEWMKDKILKRDFKAIQNDFLKSEAGKLSNPTLDHYYPVLYALGAGHDDEELKFEYEEIQNSSISMRSFRIG